MSGDTPNAGDPFPLSSSRLGGSPIQVPGLKREGLGRLYLTGSAPGRAGAASEVLFLEQAAEVQRLAGDHERALAAVVDRLGMPR